MRSSVACPAALLCLAAFGAVACQSGPRSETEIRAEREQLTLRAQATIADFKAADPGIEEFFDDAEGYVVFPTIGKGGFIVGGSHGKGVVYENTPGGAKLVGTATMTSGSIGAQIGGQSYSQIIFFETSNALANFKEGRMEIAANASAVAAEAGASAAAEYENGIAIFVKGEKGLMAEASFGGQKFDFMPAP